MYPMLRLLPGRTVAAALAAFAAAPALLAQNNSCANATPIGVGSFNGTTVGATLDGSASCGSATGPDVWYRYTAAENRLLVVTTCGGTTYDSVLSIHSGCPGTSVNQLACNDDSCGVQSRVQVVVTPGTSYLIRVSGFSGARGPFTLTVSLQDPPPPPTQGPDVTVGDLIDVGYYGAANGISAYAVGTNACNVGSAPVEWVAGTNHHPVVAQNMYRLMNGRFEQIGQSWLKHTFASTNSSDGACGSGSCQSPPNGGAQLGVSCTDAYGSGLNGSQPSLGPRSQVNATTGGFPYPFSGPAADPTIGRRLQAFTTDITPASNPGALYYVECQYVTSDDAAANNGRNNSTYRQVQFSNATTAPAFVGSSFAQQPAIQAWKAQDPSVTLVPVDYADGAIQARFWVGAKATSNGNGTWTYEYAVYNLNSDRSAGSFTAPLPGGAALTNVGFHAPFSHSGEPYSNTPWTSSQTATSLTFATDSFAVNGNANAIRWGTLYNFRFTANVAPATGEVSLGLFKPGSPTAVTVGGLPVPGQTCIADWNLSGAVEPTDIAAYVNSWFASLAGHNTAADFDASGAVEPRDVAMFVQAWFNAVINGC